MSDTNLFCQPCGGRKNRGEMEKPKMIQDVLDAGGYNS